MTGSDRPPSASVADGLRTVLRYPDPRRFGQRAVEPTPEAVANLLRDVRPEAVLTLDEAGWLDTLGTALEVSKTEVPVWPIVPNMTRFVREVTDHGVVGSQIRSFMRLGVPAQLALMLRYAPKGLKLARNDFVTGLLMLVEMDMAHFRGLQVDTVVLGSQITELGLAFENRRLFAEFLRVVRRRYGASAGLMTSNLGLLAGRLAEWELEADVVVTPFNSKGFGMNPTQDSGESAVRALGSRIVALDFDANGTIPRDEALCYLERHDVRTYAVTPL
jgi:hypothetical protein